METRGAINQYVCQECGMRTTTVNAVEGVTPFMIKCRRTPGCKGMAHSEFYRPRPGAVPAWEWYRPEGKDLERLEREAVGWKEHVAKGGLALRAIIRPDRKKSAKSGVKRKFW